MTPTRAAARCTSTVAKRRDRELSAGTRQAVATNPRAAKMLGATMNARGLNNPDAE
jgi:hypothetical protein